RKAACTVRPLALAVFSICFHMPSGNRTDRGRVPPTSKSLFGRPLLPRGGLPVGVVTRSARPFGLALTVTLMSSKTRSSSRPASSAAGLAATRTPQPSIPKERGEAARLETLRARFPHALSHDLEH